MNIFLLRITLGQKTINNRQMNSDRRKFLRNLTIGTGALATGLPAFAASSNTFRSVAVYV